MQFQDQVVVVTGASRGIGRSIAEAFAAEGAKVACVATTIEGASGTAEAIGGVAFAADVSNQESVEALFEAVTAQLGTPSVLVNNAGITRDTLLIRMKEDDWDRVIAVNLKGAFLCTKAVAKSMMKARYGRIINISSVVGQGGAAGQANYAAAKAGLFGLTKSVAKELGSRGITCNAVAPGFIETDMTSGLSEDFKQMVEKTAPIARLGTPADISPAVLFLASQNSGYITGQTITVDGGLTL
ncbi:FabG Dehydrogenases with different specificities (related to short-chain alcohol dehydrogenases) [Fimbriimonadaceae bacterium]|jgi:3-oxoacyl-[acyl-carrier protein] reductase